MAFDLDSVTYKAPNREGKKDLETGNSRRNNMPKECVDRLIKQGKSPKEAHKLCYPKGKGKKKRGY